MHFIVPRSSVISLVPNCFHWSAWCPYSTAYWRKRLCQLCTCIARFVPVILCTACSTSLLWPWCVYYLSIVATMCLLPLMHDIMQCMMIIKLIIMSEVVTHLLNINLSRYFKNVNRALFLIVKVCSRWQSVVWFINQLLYGCLQLSSPPECTHVGVWRRWDISFIMLCSP